MIIKKIFLLLLLVFSIEAFSQDIKGAYIRTEWVPTFTTTYAYTYTITLLTDLSFDNSRPTIPVNFIFTSNVATYSLSAYYETNNIGVSTYTGTYTYGGAGYYPMFYLDTFKIVNINNLGSSQTQSVLATCKQYLYTNNNSWTNKSCKINNFPPQLTVSNNKVLYDPMVTDPDGDSLSFSLVNCFNTTSYYIPSDITISPSNGVMTLSKDSLGTYAFAMEIREWKKNTSGNYTLAQVTGVDFTLDINATVGIKDLKSENAMVKIYPNPAFDKFTLEFESELKIQTNLTVFNTLGQEVYQMNNVSQKKELDLGFLKHGVYFFIVQNSSGRQLLKLVKD